MPNKLFNLEHRFCMSVESLNERYIPPPSGRVRIQILDSFVARPDAISLTRLQVIFICFFVFLFFLFFYFFV